MRQMILPLLQVVATFSLIAAAVLWVKRIRALCTALFETQERILHLYQLTDFLSTATHPSLRMFYEKLRKENKPIDSARSNQIASEISSDTFKGLKKKLQEASTTETDPGRKMKIERVLKEVDDIYLLHQSVGPDSSEEYVKTIGENILQISTKVARMLMEDLPEDLG